MDPRNSPATRPSDSEVCHCLALRQAARHVTQLYDRSLAPSGLRITQFSILAKLRHLGPQTINSLAAALVMDRTTLGRNILPLERAGLIAVVPGKADRRRKELRLTDAGRAALRAAVPSWRAAQRAFEQAFGDTRTAALRPLLHAVTQSPLGPSTDTDAD
jgi:DNA-binding MarR family transcriptional regulator